ncbi:MAG: glycerate kinase [Lachnospiraceae bacterium]
MKLVVAPDSFKGSLSASEICNIVERAAVDVFGEVEVLKLPMADGGEGTVESLLAALDSEEIHVPVKNALGEDVTAMYGIFDGDKAIIEMAAASGLPLIPKEKRNIMKSSTYGTGQLLIDAMQRGCKTIYIGIGGSATNDGGMGCAEALGAKFLNKSGEAIEGIPANFKQIYDIDCSNIHPLVEKTRIIIMSDVKNPLCGPTGATYIFGKQKGASGADFILLEEGMNHYISIVEKVCDKQVAKIEGAGAAGGLGAGLLAFTNASMRSGIQTVMDILTLEEKIDGADLVITGEGMMDHQSAYGKVAYGVGTACKNKNIPCVAIVGGMGERAEAMYEHGITSIMTTTNGIMDLSTAVERAPELCYSAAERIFRILLVQKVYN